MARYALVLFTIETSLRDLGVASGLRVNLLGQHWVRL